MPPVKTKKKGSKQRLVVELHLTYEMIYDTNSKEFGDAYASYRNSINRNGSIENMMLYVAHNVQLSGGPGAHIDGVGWVSVGGLVPVQYKDQYTGIDFKSHPSKPDIDIILNDYI